MRLGGGGSCQKFKIGSREKYWRGLLAITIIPGGGGISKLGPVL